MHLLSSSWAVQVERWTSSGGAGLWVEHAGLQAVVRHILEAAATQLGETEN